jgi:hypothetical protein
MFDLLIAFAEPYRAQVEVKFLDVLVLPEQ